VKIGDFIQVTRLAGSRGFPFQLSACAYKNYSTVGIGGEQVEAYSVAANPSGGKSNQGVQCMGDIQTDADGVPLDTTGESSLRGTALGGSERKKSVAHTVADRTRNTDATLRLDGEEDTLYEDGLELEDDSVPLTGKDGRDDSQ
jgi:hypothetical protein